MESPLSLEQLASALRAQNTTKAAKLLAALPEGEKSSPRAAILTARLRILENNLQGARNALRIAKERNANKTTILSVRADIQEAAGQYPALLRTLENLYSSAPTDVSLVLRLLRTLVQVGDTDRARAMLDVARAAGASAEQMTAAANTLSQTPPPHADSPGPEQELAGNLTRPVTGSDGFYILKRRFALQGQLGQGADQLATLNDLAARRPESFEHQMWVASAYMRLRDLPAATMTYDRVLAKWPGSVPAFEAAFAIALTAERIVHLIDLAIERLAEAPSFDTLQPKLNVMPLADADRVIDALCKKWPHAFGPRFGRGGLAATKANDPILSIFLAADQADRTEAISRLDAVLSSPRKPKTSEAINTAADLLRVLPARSELRRDEITDDGAECIISPKGDTGTTVLVFCGSSMRAGCDAVILDRFIARHGASSIFLRDTRQRFFLQGLADFGPTRADLVAGLRHHLAALDTKRIVVVTSSSGGMGGIPIGLDLGADKIISLASASGMTAEIFAAMNATYDIAPLLARLAEFTTPADLDIAQIVRDHPAKPELVMCFGAQSPFDELHAQRMATIAGATLFPIAGVDVHAITPHLLIDGSFEKLVFS